MLLTLNYYISLKLQHNYYSDAWFMNKSLFSMNLVHQLKCFRLKTYPQSKWMWNKVYYISQKFLSKIWINSFNRFCFFSEGIFWEFIYCSSVRVKWNEVWRWPLLTRSWETCMGLYSWTCEALCLNYIFLLQIWKYIYKESEFNAITNNCYSFICMKGSWNLIHPVY